MNLDLISEILGWSSVAFYISITIFNTMKFTRYAAFASAGNDILWAFLMGWWPKVILNAAVASINTFRYAKDFMKVPQTVLNVLAFAMFGGIGYISYVAISTFIANPTLPVALQFADLGIILAAIYMSSLTRYRQLMLLSGFIGMAAYFGNPQMMIIKTIVIAIMSYKLLFQRPTGSEVATV